MIKYKTAHGSKGYVVQYVDIARRYFDNRMLAQRCFDNQELPGCLIK